MNLAEKSLRMLEETDHNEDNQKDINGSMLNYSEVFKHFLSEADVNNSELIFRTIAKKLCLES